MKKLGLIAIAMFSWLLVMGCSHRPATAATPQGVQSQKAQVVDRLNMSSEDLTALINAPDNGIPDTVLAKAKCVAVIPDMVKGGFVVGGQHGRGLATCRTPRGRWSAPAPIALSGGSWGAQIGVQSADVVLLFMNNQAVQSLLNDKVKLGVDASLAAGPIGRHAEASTDVQMKSEILSYSRTKGLFAGLDLSGAKVTQDMDSTVALYGKSIPFRTILSGQVAAPTEARNFIQTVSHDFVVAASNQ